ncbi:hypothetical protein HYQ46_010448 [Verticillium longisporum]|nr:hypothetical protein HYQ46_010448 [Verticillium longisporum]
MYIFIGVSSVDGHVLAVEVLICGEEEDGARHVLVLAGTRRRHLGLVLLLGDLALLGVVGAVASRHFAGEDAGRQTVDANLDAVLGELVRQHAADMNGGSLGGVPGCVSVDFSSSGSSDVERK